MALKYQLLLELYSHRKQSEKLNWWCWKDIYLEGKFHFSGRFVITQNPVHWIKPWNKALGWLSPSETSSSSNSHPPHIPAQIKPWAQPERQSQPQAPWAEPLPALHSSSGAPLAAVCCFSPPAHSSAWRSPGAACSALLTACKQTNIVTGLLLKCQQQVMHLQPKGGFGVFSLSEIVLS